MAKYDYFNPRLQKKKKEVERKPASKKTKEDSKKDRKDLLESRQNKALQKFGKAGYTLEQATGMVGSLLGENDTMDPARTQEPHGPGFGIAQWGSHKKKYDRRIGLKKFAKEKKKDASDFDTQVDFILHELQDTEKGAARRLKKATTSEEAAQIFTQHYERPYTSLKKQRNGKKITKEEAHRGKLGKRVQDRLIKQSINIPKTLPESAVLNYSANKEGTMSKQDKKIIDVQRQIASHNKMQEDLAEETTNGLIKNNDTVTAKIREDQTMSSTKKEDLAATSMDRKSVQKSVENQLKGREAGPGLKNQFLDALTFFAPQIIGGVVGAELAGGDIRDEGMVAGAAQGGAMRDAYLKYGMDQEELDLKRQAAQTGSPTKYQQSADFMSKDGKPVIFNPETGRYQDMSGTPIPKTDVVSSKNIRQEKNIEQRMLDRGFGMAKSSQQSDAQAKAIQGYNATLSAANRIENLKKSVDTGPISGRLESAKEYADMASPEFTAMKSETESMVAEYIKAISGAQASELEVARLKKVTPLVTDNDKVFDAKLKQFKKIIEANKEAFEDSIKTGQPLRGRFKLPDQKGNFAVIDKSAQSETAVSVKKQLDIIKQIKARRGN